CFLVLAADLQDPPPLILDMVRRWQAGSKFVTCVRAKRADPPLTTLFAKLYYRVLRAVVVPNYPDGGYDLALMDQVMLPHLQSIISFLLGLVICMLGVIGEYVWRIFDEINRRPEAVIEEVH